MKGGKLNAIHIKNKSKIKDKNVPKYMLCNIIEDSKNLKDYRLFKLITDELENLENYKFYEFINNDRWSKKININNVDYLHYKMSDKFDADKLTLKISTTIDLSNSITDRIWGAFYGQFIGDALGVRYEYFSPPYSAKKMDGFIKNDTKNNFLPILGGGIHRVDPGMITDDTEMAMALLKSIMDYKKYDQKEAFYQYRKWRLSGPFDIGHATRTALQDINSPQNNYVNASHYPTNGCLMRISPLAIFGICLNDKELFDYCEKDTKITNNNYYAINCVKIFCKAVKHLILTADKVDTFNQCYKLANEIIKPEAVNEMKKMNDPAYTNALILNMMDSLDNNTRVKYKSKYMGHKHSHIYTHGIGCPNIAVQLGFYELLNGNDFYNSLVNVINRGGDTDTNGAIVGALLGAYYGYTHIQKVAQKWIDTVHIKNNSPRFDGRQGLYKKFNKYELIDQSKNGIETKIKNLIELINSKV